MLAPAWCYDRTVFLTLAKIGSCQLAMFSFEQVCCIYSSPTGHVWMGIHLISGLKGKNQRLEANW